jgi:hypothetical protein
VRQKFVPCETRASHAIWERDGSLQVKCAFFSSRGKRAKTKEEEEGKKRKEKKKEWNEEIEKE